MKNVLVIEDDKSISDLLKIHLTDLNCEVKQAADGEEGLKHAINDRYDLIVLDLMLPKLDGLEICKEVRRKDIYTPVLMLTSKSEEFDKVLGLEVGADDYLTKPFNPRELVARVKAVLRRSLSLSDLTKEEQIQFGDILIDPRRREVRIGGQPIEIRTQEFDLLYTLARHPGIVLSRDQLLDQAWGYDYYGNTRTVDVHIGLLRKKLSGSDVKIETVTKVGYKLVQ